jgi:glc operon protein GlcG
MDGKQHFESKIEKIIEIITSLLPQYMEDPIDSKITDGNAALCIIDEQGNVYGKLYGDDKVRSRRTYQIAWTKASQVWITGMATGEYEKKVFNGEIDERIYGISRPDFIGWQGGQPVALKDGSKLSVGFSGFRGISDIEIIKKALEIAD